MENINSLYFLSQQNDSRTLKSLPKGGLFNRATEVSIDSCIRHLEEVNKMLVIRNHDKSDFLSRHPDIYYDNDKGKIPSCDVVYTKINKFYFVTNNEYYEKSTQYYFTLYSAIFPYLGLKSITLKETNQNKKLSDTNLDLNLIASTVGFSNVKSENNQDDNTIKIIFEEDRNDANTLNRLKENQEQQANIIYNEMLPKNMKKSLYRTGVKNEIDLIEKRVMAKMNGFESDKVIRNTNTDKISVNLHQSFNLNTNIGLLAGYESNEFMTHHVSYILDFYKTNTSEHVEEADAESQNSDTEEEENQQEQQGSSEYVLPHDKLGIKNFYTSQPPGINGPWPNGCLDVRAVNNIKELETAKNLAYNMVLEDPKHHIVEIVEMFNFDLSSIFHKRRYSVYSVKLFYAEEDGDVDVHIGSGRRYVAFDSEQLCNCDKIIETLRNESFY